MIGTDRHADVAVVGLGGLGSAAAYRLAAAGYRVIGFEQHELGHERGASHGDSRIIRRSYHTPHYVRLTADAYAAWAEVEAASGAPLVHRTGGLDLFPAGAAISPSDYRQSLTACDVPHEWLDARELRRRWPALQLADGVHALWQPDAGHLSATEATAVHQRLARAAGAELRALTPVTELRPSRDAVDVVTATGTWTCGHVAVCADAWTPSLLGPLGIELPLVVLREQVTYLEVDDPAALAGLPVWIWMDDPSFYGFPSLDGATVKVAQDCGGAQVDPDERGFDPDADGVTRVLRFAKDLLGPTVGPPQRTTTCLYTLTPDRDFVLDRLPGHPQVIVALGAAHAFKFAAWFGSAVAALVEERSPVELAPFALDRPGLTDPSYPPAWLV